jgi:hypothetical protein
MARDVLGLIVAVIIIAAVVAAIALFSAPGHTLSP